MIQGPFDDLILLHIFLPGLFVPVRGLFIAGIGEDGNIRELFQDGFLQVDDAVLVHAVHLGQDDHDRDLVLLADLPDHLFVRFKETVVGRRHAVPDLMDMLLHFIRMRFDLVIDDLEHFLHILVLVRADLIALTVIEGHGGARRTVGMDAGRSGSSPVTDFRAFRLAHGEYIPDQGTLADSRHAAD